jgi:hypothetical protein
MFNTPRNVELKLSLTLDRLLWLGGNYKNLEKGQGFELRRVASFCVSWTLSRKSEKSFDKMPIIERALKWSCW